MILKLPARVQNVLKGEGWVIQFISRLYFLKTTRTRENLEASLPRRKKKGKFRKKEHRNRKKAGKKFYIHSRNFYLDLRFGLKKKRKETIKNQAQQGKRNDLNQKINTLTHTHATNNISPPPLSKFEFFPVLQQDPIQKKVKREVTDPIEIGGSKRKKWGREGEILNQTPTATF